MSGIKTGKTIVVPGWQDLLKGEFAPQAPAGYSNAAQIARRIGVNRGTVRERLEVLRKAGKIKAVWARISNSRPTWYFKD